MSQLQLIDSILVDLKFLDENGNLHINKHTRNLPSMLTRKIGADPNGIPFNQPWHYRMLIGKLNYLKKSTQLDISFSMELPNADWEAELPQKINSTGHIILHGTTKR
jgi:hypothetical protein